ncbi:acyl carrier protein [Streptomyces sp. NBC_00162]|uniref:acyl carrier protein n=1 Tax=Streptomyces sp. NBC_00162 TaxID=2903629 RepID=UPI00214AEDEB|nr:acyl carrier protein [Streptomyces sp. NBC_00162]UUU43751.1 acyl carrier protein [Streptomyces sp. NBC_00162]
MDPRFIEILRPSADGATGAAITPETDLRALGIDSMGAIELLFTLEDTFGISLPDTDLNDETFATAGSLWQAVAAQISPGQSSPDQSSAGQVAA